MEKMETVENLISNFHNLPGESMREKYKTFRTFLATLDVKVKTKADQDMLVAELKPRNKLEHIFRIDLLSYLKRNDELLEILKSGNSDHIGRILKNYQFFAEVVPTLKADTLINDLFPQMSFVTKTKIINRIYKSIKNEELIDQYFVAIERKYGFRMAFALAPGCSTQLIKLKIEKYKPKLTSRHVIEIYKKDTTFLLFYFTVLKNQDDTFNVSMVYPSVIKYIARKDVHLFWKLQKEFDFNFKSGKHLTKKLILQNKEILKNGEKCIMWFQTKKLYNTINQCGKIEDFLLSFYHDTPIEFLETHIISHSDIYKILEFLTPERRYGLIQDLFNKKYCKNILTYEMKFPQHFLELIPLSVREPIVKKHLEKSDDYTYLLRPREAIDAIKGLLQNCSTCEERTQKLEQLCKLLKINRRAKEKITEVFKFIFERYRNDIRALKAFVYAFTDDRKNLEILDEEQLRLLNQMGVYTITEYSNRYAYEKISSVYLQWLIKNNKNYDEFLRDYLKRFCEDDISYYNELFQAQFENMNIVLEKTIDMVDDFKDNKKVYDKLNVALVNHILSYNKQHKKNSIPWARYKHIFKSVLNVEDVHSICVSGEQIMYAIKKYNDADIHKYFWKHYENMYMWDMLPWYFKNDVKQIEENLELILSRIVHRAALYIYNIFEMYATESLRKKTVEHIRTKISFDHPNISAYLITVLSYVDSEEFLKITAPFMPPADGKFDDENAAKKKEVHEAIIRSLCNIKSESLLEILKRVCVADYLKYGLQPLYKFIYNMKETDILSVLSILKDSPVSLGKHSLLLSRHLLPIKEASEFIQKALQNEQNVSMKNIIFKKSLDLLIETQTEAAWKLLHNYFCIVNSDDTAMHDLLIKYINKIPACFVNDYIQCTYEVIKKTTSKEVIKKITSLAKNIPYSILNTISFKILEDIIGMIVREIFLHQTNEDCFWCFILHTNSNRSKQLLSCTLEMMKEIISDVNPGYVKLRTQLNNFGTSFCMKLLKEKKIEHKQLIEMFDLQWNFFPKYCLLDTVLFLKLTVAYYESEFDLNKFAFLLSKLLHKYVEEYDSSIILEFSNHLTSLCDITDIKDDTLYTLADLLLQCNDHKYNYILAIYLLPRAAFPSEDNKYRKWISIVKIIEEYEEKVKNAPSILFHYDKYLRDHRHEYIWIGNQQFPSVTTTKL